MKLKIKLCKVTSANTDRLIKEWPVEVEFYKNGRPRILIGAPDYPDFKHALKEELERR
jgi:hypothetical protein